MKTKDIVVIDKAGLYLMCLMHHPTETFGFTNLANATHFTGKTDAKKAIDSFLTEEMRNGLRFVDLNDKRSSRQAR